MTANDSSGSESVSTSAVGEPSKSVDWKSLVSESRELFGALLGAQVSKVEKPWGSEYVIAPPDFLLKVIEVLDGHRTSLQHHNEKTEIHWLLSGVGYLYHDVEDAGDDRFYYRPSAGILVQPGEIHRAVGPLLILEISTNHPDDVVRHKDDYSREDSPQ